MRRAPSYLVAPFASQELAFLISLAYGQGSSMVTPSNHAATMQSDVSAAQNVAILSPRNNSSNAISSAVTLKLPAFFNPTLQSTSATR